MNWSSIAEAMYDRFVALQDKRDRFRSPKWDDLRPEERNAWIEVAQEAGRLIGKAVMA